MYLKSHLAYMEVRCTSLRKLHIGSWEIDVINDQTATIVTSVHMLTTTLSKGRFPVVRNVFRLHLLEYQKPLLRSSHGIITRE